MLSPGQKIRPTTLGIPKWNRAYKNLRRTQQILTILAKHGFSQIIESAGLDKLVPFHRKDESKESLKKSVPERLCLAFEEIGPTFVKLGQMIASRPDLVTPGYAKTFERLRDDVKTVPLDAIRRVVEEEFDAKTENLFHSFGAQPIAAASIAQVHAATLTDNHGVVVKVQRPGLVREIETDISILYLLAKLSEKYLPELSAYDPVGIVDEFARLVRSETDFIEEAHNIDAIGTYFADDPKVVIPGIFWELTSRRVLTMERIDGIPLHDIARLKSEGYDLPEICRVGADAFLRQVFDLGIFHADLHGGNVFVLPENRIALIDFGEVGRLGSNAQTSIANIFAALLSKDFQSLAREYIDLGTPTGPVDLARFSDDLEKLLSPLFGRKIRDINLGGLLTKAATLASEHHVRLPRDLVLLGRVILTMEDLIRKLDPEFDFLQQGGQFAAEIIRKKLQPQRLAKDLMWNLRDFSELSRVLPAQIKYITSKLSTNDLTIQIDARNVVRAIGDTSGALARLGLAVVASGFFIGASILSSLERGPRYFDLPLMSWIGFGVSLGLGAVVLLSSLRSGKRS